MTHSIDLTRKWEWLESENESFPLITNRWSQRDIKKIKIQRDKHILLLAWNAFLRKKKTIHKLSIDGVLDDTASRCAHKNVFFGYGVRTVIKAVRNSNRHCPWLVVHWVRHFSFRTAHEMNRLEMNRVPSTDRAWRHYVVDECHLVKNLWPR